MVEITRTNSSQPDFLVLVTRLDAYLAEKDGADHAFYSQFNKVDKIKFVVVAYENGEPVGCGAIKEYATGTMEVKRMYTAPESRGKGIASRVLTELETWAREMGYEKCLLETGTKQDEALRLYQKSGYTIIPNYGQYAEVEGSVCFEKALTRRLPSPAPDALAHRG